MKGFNLIKVFYFCVCASILIAQSDNIQLQQAIETSPEIIDSDVEPEITITSTGLDTLEFDSDSDIFDAQLTEAKMIYAEAIISDLTGDTLEATYQFDILLSCFKCITS